MQSNRWARYIALAFCTATFILVACGSETTTSEPSGVQPETIEQVTPATSTIPHTSASESARAPVVEIIVDKRAGSAPLRVSFQAEFVGQVTDLRWDFGDSELSGIENPVYHFTKAGEHTITVTVDGPGGRAIASRIITVGPGAPAKVSVSPSPVFSKVGERTPLSVQVMDIFGNEFTGASIELLTTGPGGTIGEAGIFIAGNQAGIYPNLIEIRATFLGSTVVGFADVEIMPESVAEPSRN